MAFVPACVVPDQKQGLLTPRLEPLATPPKKLRGYGAHRAAIYKPKPALFELRQIQPVAGERLRLGIVLPRLFLEEAHRLARLSPGVHRRPLKARKPTLILKAKSPLRMALGQPDQPISIPLSEKAPRVKRERGLCAHLRRAPGGSRPFACLARGTKEASGGS